MDSCPGRFPSRISRVRVLVSARYQKVKDLILQFIVSIRYEVAFRAIPGPDRRAFQPKSTFVPPCLASSAASAANSSPPPRVSTQLRPSWR